MSDKPLLSPEELEALADGLDTGAIAVDTGFNTGAKVRKHDLASEDSSLGVNLQSIDMINERFIRQFRLGSSGGVANQSATQPFPGANSALWRLFKKAESALIGQYHAC